MRKIADVELKSDDIILPRILHLYARRFHKMVWQTGYNVILRQK